MSGSTLTVVEHVYHQQHGSEPTCVDVVLSRVLPSDEPCYVLPTFVVGSEWIPVPTGHLKGKPVALIVLRNDEGRFVDRLPTPDEIEEVSRRVIEVAVMDVTSEPVFVIDPGHMFKGRPVRPDNLLVRCPTGRAVCHLKVIPA